MGCTISDLWKGCIAPCEHCGAHDAQSNRLSSLMERYQEALCKELSLEEMEIFRNYMDCSQEFLLRTAELAFQEGFRLGSRLMLEGVTE